MRQQSSYPNPSRCWKLDRFDKLDKLDKQGKLDKLDKQGKLDKLDI